MKLSRNAARACLGVAWLTLAQATHAQEPRDTAEVRTPLHGLGRGESLVARIVETLPGAPPIQVAVDFVDEGDDVVKRVRGTVGPGSPFRAVFARTELRTGSRFSSVRAVVRLDREGGFSRNIALLNFDFYDEAGLVDRCGGGCSICAHDGFSCAPASQGGPDVICDNGPVLVFEE